MPALPQTNALRISFGGRWGTYNVDQYIIRTTKTSGPIDSGPLSVSQGVWKTLARWRSLTLAISHVLNLMIMAKGPTPTTGIPQLYSIDLGGVDKMHPSVMAQETLLTALTLS